MPSLDSFRTARWVRTLNLVLQAILFITLFGGLNYLARNHSLRYDLTAQRRHSLSPETLSYLQHLPRPVHIVVTLNPASDNNDVAQAYRDVRALLREYTYATENDANHRITVDYLDVYQRRREAEQLGIDQPDSIVLICGDRRRTVTLGEIYQMEKGVKKSFRGEQAFTAALLDVSSPGKKKIYFLTGHGELNPEDVDPVRGLSMLRDELRARNFDVERLELVSGGKVPADAALLISVAPQGRYTPEEQEQLRQYLGPGAGRMILLLEPAMPFGLSNLLLDWGILVDDDLVYDTGADNITEEGDLIVRLFLPHPITQTLLDRQIPLRIGPARSLRPDPGRKQGNDLTVTTFAVTSKSAWGEVGYRLRVAPEYDPGIDIKNDKPGLEPPDHLALGIASERVSARAGLDFSVRGGRLVVFGTGDLIANNRIAGAANLGIFLGAVNWTVDRDAQFNIPVRQIERFSLSLSAGDLARLRRTLLFLLPGGALLLGLIVYWTRRR
ncbi:MAG: GldG family protein [Opitutaceae bacterium]